MSNLARSLRLSRRHFIASACAGTAAFAVCGGAAAQTETFPARPIKLLVPYAAGGGTDAIARLVAQSVSEELGQSVVIENNGHAGGNIATHQAATAAPDGYTVLMANQGPMVVNPHLFKSVKIDPLKAFDPVTLIASAPLLVVVRTDSGFKSLADLVASAKQKAGKLTYGSAGNGSASHLATVLFEQQAGFRAVHIPYRGAGPAINDLLGGQLDFMITTVPSILGQIEGKLLTPLAVTSTERAAIFPDLPSVAESGWPSYSAAAWYGFAVPKGTSPERIEILRAATVKAINSSVLKDRLAKEGTVPIGSEPSAFADMMNRESAMWAQVIKTAGLALN